MYQWYIYRLSIRLPTLEVEIWQPSVWPCLDVLMPRLGITLAQCHDLGFGSVLHLLPCLELPCLELAVWPNSWFLKFWLVVLHCLSCESSFKRSQTYVTNNILFHRGIKHLYKLPCLLGFEPSTSGSELHCITCFDRVTNASWNKLPLYLLTYLNRPWSLSLEYRCCFTAAAEGINIFKKSAA